MSKEVGAGGRLDIFLDSASPCCKEKAAIKYCKKVSKVGKKLASRCSGVALVTPCHPMATGLMLITKIRP